MLRCEMILPPISKSQLVKSQTSSPIRVPNLATVALHEGRLSAKWTMLKRKDVFHGHSF